MMTTDRQAKPLDVAKALKVVRRPLIVSHAKPDGDAIGAILALGDFLTGLGSAPTCLIFDELPDRYQWLDRKGVLRQLGGDIRERELNGFDAVIIADTCTYSQLEPIADWLRTAACRKLVVDPHQTRDQRADTYLLDDSAAATCLIIYELARECGWSISGAAAEALFTGIATDTGWLKHSNTNGRALAACADLVDRGVNANRIFSLLYQADKPQRIRLLGRAVESLEMLENDRLAVMTLPAQAFVDLGAAPGDTEDIVNEPLRIATVLVSALLVEQEGVIRVNLRSRAPHNPGDADIDVSRIASQLGGGGHRRAAGVRLQMPLPQARENLLRHLLPLFKSR